MTGATWSGPSIVQGTAKQPKPEPLHCHDRRHETSKTMEEKIKQVNANILSINCYDCVYVSARFTVTYN